MAVEEVIDQMVEIVGSRPVGSLRHIGSQEGIHEGVGTDTIDLVDGNPNRGSYQMQVFDGRHQEKMQEVRARHKQSSADFRDGVKTLGRAALLLGLGYWGVTRLFPDAHELADSITEGREWLRTYGAPPSILYH